MIFIYFSTCGYSIGILEMIVLCFSMDGEDVLSIPMASIMCIYFSMQEEGVLEHTMVLSGPGIRGTQVKSSVWMKKTQESSK